MQMKSDTMTAEQKVQCVIGTMQIEGFEVTDKTRELLRKVANKEATAEELLKGVLHAYQK